MRNSHWIFFRRTRRTLSCFAMLRLKNFRFEFVYLDSSRRLLNFLGLPPVVYASNRSIMLTLTRFSAYAEDSQTSK